MAGRIHRFDSYDLRKHMGSGIKTFIDIGANVGTTSIMARVLFPKAKIIAIEPADATFEKLTFFSSWFIECFQFALGDGKPVCFHDRAHLGLNRFYTEDEANLWPKDSYTVPNLPLSEIVSKFGMAAPCIGEDLPDAIKLLHFRHLLDRRVWACRTSEEANALTGRKVLLREGTLLDATILAAPCSTKSRRGEREPDMLPTKKRQSVGIRDERAHRRGRGSRASAHALLFKSGRAHALHRLSKRWFIFRP